MENLSFFGESLDTSQPSTPDLDELGDDNPTGAPHTDPKQVSQGASHIPTDASPRMPPLIPHFQGSVQPSPDFLHLLRYFEEARLAAAYKMEERCLQEEHRRQADERRWRQEEVDRREADNQWFLLTLQGFQVANQAPFAS